MKAGIASLILAYVMSQFYRAFLAVLTPVLKADLGAGAEDLAAASSLWFLAFAAMQVVVAGIGSVPICVPIYSATCVRARGTRPTTRRSIRVGLIVSIAIVTSPAF